MMGVVGLFLMRDEGVTVCKVLKFFCLTIRFRMSFEE